MRAKTNPENPVKRVIEEMTGVPFGANTQEEKIIPPFVGVEQEEKDVAIEIVPGMTVEEMCAMFFDEAIIEPTYKVYQLNSKGHRYYYRYNEDGTPEFYPSVTTILSQTLPQSPFLVKWIAEKGYEEAERYKSERAAYGTFMHAQFEELLIARAYDLDSLKGRLRAYIEQHNLPDDFVYYADDLKKDVLAFAQFVIDYDVRPLAVEIALVHPELGYAGCIDMPCNMRVKPGSSDRVNAIVDFKSGRKGFFEEHEIQLHLYKMMWNANFPECEIERVYNFSPKDWRKKPTYNFKDQTDCKSAKKIPALLELAAIEDDKRDNVFTTVSGFIALERTPDLSDNIISLTLSELVQKTPAAKAPTAEKVQCESEEGKKTPAEADILPDTETKPVKRATARKTSEAPVKTAKKAAKAKLLNNDMEI